MDEKQLRLETMTESQFKRILKREIRQFEMDYRIEVQNRKIMGYVLNAFISMITAVIITLLLRQ